MPLQKAMHEAIKSGHQIMLLLNRRGFSSFLICGSCGFVPECPNCSVSLTNYKGSGSLRCHYCGFNCQSPSTCRSCGTKNLQPGTPGTEALEEEVRSLFPSSRVLRIDRESMEKRGALEKALSRVASREVDIVIGTQIIAKGHDFPNISLVGVINADSGFHLPDFRASEKSFQLFTQMAGRAGRGEVAGQVIVQTFNPKHPSILHASAHDYRSFAEEELSYRRQFEYPPYTRLARLLVTGKTSEEAEEGSLRLFRELSKVSLPTPVEIIGPAPAVLSKIKSRYRWNLILKSAKAKSLHALIDLAIRRANEILNADSSLQVDVDPVSLM